MSSTVSGDLQKGGRPSRVVTCPEHESVRTAGGAGVECATDVASAWSVPVPVEYLNSEYQMPQAVLPHEPFEGTEGATAAKVAIVVGDDEAAIERSPDQNNSTSWLPESHIEQAPPPNNWPQNEAPGSSCLRRREEIRQKMEAHKSVPAEDATDSQLSETAENQEPAETPLFGSSLKEDASSTAQGSPTSLEEPASIREEASSHAVLYKQMPSSASASGQRVSDPAQLPSPNALDKSPPCNDEDLHSVDKIVTSHEQDVLSDERDVPNADAIDADEGGNEPVGGSSWCLSLSTSSDTRSDTHHVLHCLDIHPHGCSSHLQRKSLTSSRQAPTQEIALFPTYARTNADAVLSSATIEGNRSLAGGSREARKDLEGDRKDLSDEDNQDCLPYGKAKVATDVLAGLAGMQPVAIINCFVSDSPLGGVLSMFCLFSSAFAHYDKRPASYFLCSLLAFSLATTLIIALCSKLAGFESFHSVQMLRRMSIAHAAVLLLTGLIAGGLGSRALLTSMAHRETSFGGKCLKPLICHRHRR